MNSFHLGSNEALLSLVEKSLRVLNLGGLFLLRDSFEGNFIKRVFYGIKLFTYGV